MLLIGLSEKESLWMLLSALVKFNRKSPQPDVAKLWFVSHNVANVFNWSGSIAYLKPPTLTPSAYLE